jgi:hypothetical protein
MTLTLMLIDSDEAYRKKLRAWTRVHPELGMTLVDMAEVPQGMAKAPQDMVEVPQGWQEDPQGRPQGDGAVLPADTVMLLGVKHAPLPAQWPPSGSRLVLLEENGMVTTLPGCAASDGDRPILRKYQPATLFFQSLLQVAAEKGWHQPQVSDAARCRMTVLLHPAGSVHLAPVLPVLAALCARKAETVILSLNAAMETGFWYAGDTGGGLTRMAYEAQRAPRIGTEALRRCLVRDEGTGVHVLHSAELPEDAAAVRADTVAGTLQACGELGMEMLLVDGGDMLSARNLQLALAADQVLFVLPADLYGAHMMARVVQLDGRLRRTGAGCWRDNQPVRWLFMGTDMPAIRCALPETHAVKALPPAYPDGPVSDGWEVSDAFLRSLHALVPFCGRCAS